MINFQGIINFHSSIPRPFSPLAVTCIGRLLLMPQTPYTTHTAKFVRLWTRRHWPFWCT